jgi:protein-tyrosine phosphatase
MAAHDLDLSEHRSAGTSGADLEAADLVVGMAREHVRDAIAIDPAVRPRAFTLKELVRLGEANGPRRDDEAVEAWLGRLDAARDPSNVLGAAKVDDVTDPIGRSARTYRRTAAELDDLTQRLAALLA